MAGEFSGRAGNSPLAFVGGISPKSVSSRVRLFNRQRLAGDPRQFRIDGGSIVPVGAELLDKLSGSPGSNHWDTQSSSDVDLAHQDVTCPREGEDFYWMNGAQAPGPVRPLVEPLTVEPFRRLVRVAAVLEVFHCVQQSDVSPNSESRHMPTIAIHGIWRGRPPNRPPPIPIGGWKGRGVGGEPLPAQTLPDPCCFFGWSAGPAVRLAQAGESTGSNVRMSCPSGGAQCLAVS